MSVKEAGPREWSRPACPRRANRSRLARQREFPVAERSGGYTFLRGLARWLSRGLAAVVALLLVLLILWRFVPPVSTLMAARMIALRPVERTWTPLARFSPVLVASVVASEDGQFCRHRGVDWSALREVMGKAGADGPSRGASTISMQIARNLFLWPARSAIRKALEIPLALAIDLLWGKQRVVEVYLNVAEWGDAGFGAAESLSARPLETGGPAAADRQPDRASRRPRGRLARLSAATGNVSRNRLWPSANFQCISAAPISRAPPEGPGRPPFRRRKWLFQDAKPRQ